MDRASSLDAAELFMMRSMGDGILQLVDVRIALSHVRSAPRRRSALPRVLTDPRDALAPL